MSGIDGRLVDEFTQGIAAPQGSGDALKLARANADGTNLEYIEANEAVAGDGSLAAALAPHLRGVGLTVDANNKLKLRLRARRLTYSDHFISGNNTSGSIGKLNWNLLGTGTPAVTRQDATSFARGAYDLSTSNVANNRSVLALGNIETRVLGTISELNFLQCGVLLSDLSNKRFAFGMAQNMGTEPSASANAVWIYYDSANANYQVVSRAASVGTPFNTGVPFPINTRQLITIQQTVPGTYEFRVGATLVHTISGAGIPTASMNVGFRLETLTAGVATARIGWFGMDADLADSLDDDTFLES